MRPSFGPFGSVPLDGLGLEGIRVTFLAGERVKEVPLRVELRPPFGPFGRVPLDGLGLEGLRVTEVPFTVEFLPPFGPFRTVPLDVLGFEGLRVTFLGGERVKEVPLRVELSPPRGKVPLDGTGLGRRVVLGRVVFLGEDGTWDVEFVPVEFPWRPQE